MDIIASISFYVLSHSRPLHTESHVSGNGKQPS